MSNLKSIHNLFGALGRSPRAWLRSFLSWDQKCHCVYVPLGHLHFKDWSTGWSENKCSQLQDSSEMLIEVSSIEDPFWMWSYWMWKERGLRSQAVINPQGRGTIDFITGSGKGNLPFGWTCDTLKKGLRTLVMREAIWYPQHPSLHPSTL